MVREIVHDPMFLQRKSEDATQADLQTAQDLLDTLRANFDRCVGMAANMIGVAKKFYCNLFITTNFTVNLNLFWIIVL